MFSPGMFLAWHERWCESTVYLRTTHHHDAWCEWSTGTVTKGAVLCLPCAGTRWACGGPRWLLLRLATPVHFCFPLLRLDTGSLRGCLCNVRVWQCYRLVFKKTSFFVDGFMAKAEKVEDGIFQVAECFNYFYFTLCCMLL